MHTFQLPTKYILVYTPKHPYTNKKGYVYEHRLILEEKLGRFLAFNEEVNHINGIRDDNRPENLELVSSKLEHGQITRMRHIQEKGGNPLIEKFCTECNQIKSKYSFYNNHKTRDSLDTICKSCRKIRSRRNYATLS